MAWVVCPNYSTVDFSDIFEDLFNFGFGGSRGGRSRNRPKRGADFKLSCQT